MRHYYWSEKRGAMAAPQSPRLCMIRSARTRRRMTVNWDIELKSIEREFSGLPSLPSAGAQNARRAAERSAQQQRDAGRAALGAWARLLLVVGLAGGLYAWPYARECGVGLYSYMGAQSLVLAGALWVVAWTWRWRMVRTHALALMMALVGLLLIGSQALPRVGYAKVDPANPPRWSCAG
jgi:hypothetical protein